MKKGVGTLSVLMLLLAIACSTGKRTNRDKYLNGKGAIAVANVFPEKGLTDPHSIIVDGKLYVFCGHDKSWDTEDNWIMDRWEIWSTDNLVEWNKEGEIHPKDTYIGDLPNCFAGDIISRNGKYFWYFSNRSESTGVMVSDSPAGPFKDALGKPLLPKGIAGVNHPYDPEVYEEDGVYTIIFGAGHYYAATLAEDMISIADEPQAIKVFDENGNDVWTADKACVFKRDNKYYLIWEEKYAMSDNLHGPYTYMGESLKGGHCNVFVWDNQYYVLIENKDISLFYRGVSLKPLNFNEDGTIRIPEDDDGFPANGRAWDYKLSRMGWRAVGGTELEWNESGKIYGEITGNAIIESSNWLLTDLEKHQTVILKLRNNSPSTQAKIGIASVNPKGGFWKTPEIDWDEQDFIMVNIQPNSMALQEFKISLAGLPKLKSMLKRVRIEPAVGATSGSWEIEYLSVE